MPISSFLRSFHNESFELTTTEKDNKMILRVDFLNIPVVNDLQCMRISVANANPAICDYNHKRFYHVLSQHEITEFDSFLRPIEVSHLVGQPRTDEGI